MSAYFASPANMANGWGTAAIIVIGIVVAVALVVTLLGVVVHTLRWEDRHRHTH